MATIDIPCDDVQYLNQTHGVIVGGTTALMSDDGDASYVEYQPGGTQGIGNFAVNFPATAVPSSATVEIVGVARLYNNAPAGTSFALVAGTGPQQIGAWGAPGPTAYAEFVVPTTSITPEAITAGEVKWSTWPDAADLLLNPGVRVTYLALRVTYTTVRRAPHNRIVQRGNDGLGVSGGQRVVQRRTIHASNRVVGIR